MTLPDAFWRETPQPQPCEDCAMAAKRLWHGFMADCKGCAARAAARSPHFRRVHDAGMQDRAYRSMLQLYGVTHEQVRAAAAVDQGHA
jgi:hypothetical protein